MPVGHGRRRTDKNFLNKKQLELKILVVFYLHELLKSKILLAVKLETGEKTHRKSLGIDKLKKTCFQIAPNPEVIFLFFLVDRMHIKPTESRA